VLFINLFRLLQCLQDSYRYRLYKYRREQNSTHAFEEGCDLVRNFRYNRKLPYIACQAWKIVRTHEGLILQPAYLLVKEPRQQAYCGGQDHLILLLCLCRKPSQRVEDEFPTDTICHRKNRTRLFLSSEYLADFRVANKARL
jgi:hypothetical protein